LADVTRKQVQIMHFACAFDSRRSEDEGRAMILYGLKTCDTCRKALKALPNAEFVDVSKTPVPEAVLDRARDLYGDRVLNTRSTTWRGLDAAERAKEPKTLLADHPKLMKRPLIVDGSSIHLGWDKTTQTALGV